MTALEFLQTRPDLLSDYQSKAAQFGNSPDAYLSNWTNTMNSTFGAGNWNKPNLSTGTSAPQVVSTAAQDYNALVNPVSTSTAAPATAPATGTTPATAANTISGASNTSPAATNSSLDFSQLTVNNGQTPGSTTPIATSGTPLNVSTTGVTTIPAHAGGTTATGTTGAGTGTTGTGTATNTAGSGPTAEERAWINNNLGLTQQLFGSTNPPAGAVRNYVAGWYAQNPNAQVDAIDHAVLNPGSTSNIASATIPATGVVGGNYNMVEAGNQTGGYNSTGSTSQTQNGAQSSTGAETQHQVNNTTTANNVVNQGTTSQGTTGATTEQTAGTNTQQQIGQQATTGATTGSTAVTTPFDIQSLVAAQLPNIAASDRNRTGFLTDVMNTGGQQFNSQVDQAVRNSLTGPVMTGAGDSARARAAGYAGAQVARTNLDERLQAANQLAGSSGLGSITQQTAPLFGTQTAGTSTGNTATTGTSTGTNATTSAGTNQSNTVGLNNNTQTSTGSSLSDMQSALSKASNTIDFQQLVGNEQQSGNAVGSSASSGAGTVPQGQPVKTGGCVVCTAYGMAPGAIRRAVRWKLSQGKRYETSVAGYMLYGPVLARAVLRWPTISKLFRPLARSILYHEVKLSAPTRLRWRLVPFITHEVFNRLSWPVGLISRLVGRDHVTCPTVLALLKSRNLSFQL